MKRTYALLAVALVVAASSVALASAHSTRAHRSATATLELRETGVGMIVVNSEGFTLFQFTKDKKNKDECVGISGCTGTWPPLEVSGTPTAGTGVNAKLLGTIKLSTGGTQVTYAGHPLYGYVGDTKAGETAYVGVKEFGGTWYAISAKGKKVKQPKKKSSSGGGEGGGGGW